MFNVTGTRVSGDWLTNIKLGLGVGYKESDRYKQSHKALRDAKQKYNAKNAVVTAHSVKADLSQITSQVKAIML